jgi:hypothetical protein
MLVGLFDLLMIVCLIYNMDLPDTLLLLYGPMALILFSLCDGAFVIIICCAATNITCFSKQVGLMDSPNSCHCDFVFTIVIGNMESSRNFLPVVLNSTNVPRAGLKIRLFYWLDCLTSI